MGWRAGPRAAWLLAALLLCGCQTARPSCASGAAGIVWQPSLQQVDPKGRWEQLGARQLLVQWLEVDDVRFFAAQAPGAPDGAAMPATNWRRVFGEPWARQVILGLAGRNSEEQARRQVVELGQRSRAVAQAWRHAGLPDPAGWYFPVEVDPTWNGGEALAAALAGLPRPLWISAYDSANRGPEALADWLQRWVPADVGVFFQDGVGVHAREPAVAVQYLDVLSRRLGKQRVRLIAEAFRPGVGGGFRPATAQELGVQLASYRGWPVYLFDGPHYVSEALIRELCAPRP